MITRNVQFPDELYQKLRELAEKKGVSISAIIKIACDEYIKNQGK